MCNLHWRYTFCTGVTLFALVSHLDCTSLSQSESTNFSCILLCTVKATAQCNTIKTPYIFSWSHPFYLGRVRLGYSGIRIYSGIYFGYSAPGSRIAGMEIQVLRNENSSQTNAYSRYSHYSYSGLIPNERALKWNSCTIFVIYKRKKEYISPKVGRKYDYFCIQPGYEKCAFLKICKRECILAAFKEGF